MKYILTILTGLLFHAFVQGQSIKIDPYHYASVKRIVVENGAVASAHPLASDVGAMILKKGGNAIDAAVAVQFALAVVYPRAGNIGGGGYAVIHLANGTNTAIDYREKAPGKATRYMFVKNGRSSPELRHNGNLAAGVPGTVAGIFLAHEKYGKLPMKELIQPAIDLAKNGFVITLRDARSFNYNQKAFKKYNTVTPVFVKPRGWYVGDTLVQKDLAHTLELIRDHGKAGFYEGETAKKIVAEMKRGNGIISLQDLKNYNAAEREPIAFDYKGYTVVSMPPSSSGGIALQQMLGMLKHYPVEEYGFESVRAVQLMTEIERRAFSDRAAYLTDPDFVKMPLKAMVSDAYLQKRMATYDPHHATPRNAIRAKIRLPVESKETTHISVVDGAGNAVAVTYTLSSNYGCKIVVGHAGFFLNNEMRAFSSNPRKGNIVNTIRPGIRMRSSMSPTVVLKDEKPYLVLGTPGSETIITSVFQTLVDIIDFNMSVSDAVNKPKFHYSRSKNMIYVEKGFPADVIKELKNMGYKFKTNRVIGRMEVIRVANGNIEAVADRRGDDSAAGY